MLLDVYGLCNDCVSLYLKFTDLSIIRTNYDINEKRQNHDI